MSFHFDRPVGATADVAELEYVSALMQTEKLFLRQEGSLTARDIHFFLKSRYGLRVDNEEIAQKIIVELGGTIRTRGKKSTTAPASDKESTIDCVVETIAIGDNWNKEADVEVAAHIPTIRANPEEPPKETLEQEANNQEQVQASAVKASGRPKLKKMSMRLSTLQLTQAFNQEDYEKYQNYKAVKKSEANPLFLQEEEAGPTLLVDSEEEEVKINLCQLASVILIPKLRKLRWDNDHSSKKSAFSNDENNHLKITKLGEDSIDLFLAIVIMESGLSHGQELNREAMIQILSLSMSPEWMDHVLDPMMESLQSVASHTSDGIPRLDRDTLLWVLTEDVLAFNVDYLNCTQETVIEEANAIKSGKHSNEEPPELTRIYTASNIDNNADTYQSNTWTILAWYAIVVTLFAYLFNGVTVNGSWGDIDCALFHGKVSCAVAIATVNWLELFLTLSIIGTPIYFLSTLGNSIYKRGKILTLVAIVWVGFYVYFPFFYKADFGAFHTDPPPDEPEVQNNSSFMGPVSVALGSILMIVLLLQVVPFPWYKKKGYVTYNLRSALSTKHAAVTKVERLVRNAVKCHIISDSSKFVILKKSTTQGPKITNLRPLTSTMIKYQQSFTHTEKAGGILWTWRKIRDRSIFWDEGVWIWSRLLASNFAQWFTMLIWIGVAIFGLRELSKDEPFLEGIMTNEDLTKVLVAGFPLAFIVSFAISVSYVPSTITSILKYRSGVKGSLRDRRFLQNRFAMDSANLMFGAAFWTCLFSAAFFYIFISAATFLCIHKDTQDAMIALIANLIGMGITVILKQVIMLFIRSRWSRGYYRSRPAVVNISNTMQEVWNLGLTTFTAVTRSFKFLGIFLLYLGRIDTEVFAPGIGWLWDEIPIDGLPHCFLRDLLLHEAHRHPLIERLGLIYMIKLRLGSDFGSSGGAAWRLMFTCSLMPWLEKYGQDLGVLRQSPEQEKEDREASLAGLSKDALVDNFMQLEDQYRMLADKVKSLGHDSSLGGIMGSFNPLPSTGKEGGADGLKEGRESTP